MPLKKEYCSAGNTTKKNINDLLSALVGIFGAVVILIGMSQDSAQLYYVIGSSSLLVTAIYYKLTFFIALELILLSGHGAKLLGLGVVSQTFLPILLSFQLLVYYLLSGQLKNIYRLLGIIGISMLSIGFSYSHLWVFFLGSLFVATYALHNVYTGKNIALIWGVLNSIFTFTMAALILFN